MDPSKHVKQTRKLIERKNIVYEAISARNVPLIDRYQEAGRINLSDSELNPS